MNKKTKIILFTILTIMIIMTLTYILKSPQQNRNWSQDQKILSYTEFENNLIHIYNIRNISYRNETDYDLSYYNKTFDLNKLETLDYLLERFSDFEGAAHTMLSFGFSDGTYLAISIEIRKEVGESFSPFKGLIKEYEVMYVVADEEDVIKLRTNYRKDPTFLYPIKITKESLDKLFIGMLKETNNLKEKPRFYNTLTSTCTTEIAKHSNKYTHENFNLLSSNILLPGYSDKLLYIKGLINTDLPYEKIREHFSINDLAKEFGNSKDFSKKIRSKR